MLNVSAVTTCKLAPQAAEALPYPEFREEISEMEPDGWWHFFQGKKSASGVLSFGRRLIVPRVGFKSPGAN